MRGASVPESPAMPAAYGGQVIGYSKFRFHRYWVVEFLAFATIGIIMPVLMTMNSENPIGAFLGGVTLRRLLICFLFSNLIAWVVFRCARRSWTAAHVTFFSLFSLLGLVVLLNTLLAARFAYHLESSRQELERAARTANGNSGAVASSSSRPASVRSMATDLVDTKIEGHKKAQDNAHDRWMGDVGFFILHKGFDFSTMPTQSALGGRETDADRAHDRGREYLELFDGAEKSLRSELQNLGLDQRESLRAERRVNSYLSQRSRGIRDQVAEMTAMMAEGQALLKVMNAHWGHWSVAEDTGSVQFDETVPAEVVEQYEQFFEKWQLPKKGASYREYH